MYSIANIKSETVEGMLLLISIGLLAKEWNMDPEKVLAILIDRHLEIAEKFKQLLS
jgi:hypothetical protein